jgi:hypothetical protein
VEARQGKGEGGLARAGLQMSGEVEEGEMASRGARRGVQGFYLQAMSSVLGALRRKRLEGWGGVSGTALWSQFSGVVDVVGGETLGSETCGFQIMCTACRARLRRSGRLRLRWGGAW